MHWFFRMKEGFNNLAIGDEEEVAFQIGDGGKRENGIMSII